MRYFGGKAKIAKEIAGCINTVRKSGQLYIEPFVGAGNIIASILDNPNLCCDLQPDLIVMWKALQQGWEPPDELEEDAWQILKEETESSPLKCFAGFALSFGGKYFQGYARDNVGGRSFCQESKQALMHRFYNIPQNTEFRNCNYRELKPKNAVIYCDPPYEESTKFHGLKSSFSSWIFWMVMRKWSENNMVLISERSAPKDFKCVWYKQGRISLSLSETKLTKFEGLYVHQSNWLQYCKSK